MNSTPPSNDHCSTPSPDTSPFHAPAAQQNPYVRTHIPNSLMLPNEYVPPSTTQHEEGYQSSASSEPEFDKCVPNIVYLPTAMYNYESTWYTEEFPKLEDIPGATTEFILGIGGYSESDCKEYMSNDMKLLHKRI